MHEIERPPVLWLGSPSLEAMRELSDRSVREMESWSELRSVLRGEGPATVVVLDPYGDAAGPAEEFWELLHRFPSTSFVPAFALREERVPDLRRMLAEGASEVCNLERENSPSLLALRVRSAFARPLKRRIDAALSPFTPAEARIIVTAAVEVAAAGGGAPELAARFGVMPKTVVTWCNAAGLPTPGLLLAWMRVLIAAQLMEEPGRTLQSVATACGYATARSLRRSIQRFAGASRSPRREGLFEALAALLNHEMRERREARRSAPARSRNAAAPIHEGEVQPYPAP